MDLIRQAAGDDAHELPRVQLRHRARCAVRPPVPGRIRVAVLDGAVDPLLDPITRSPTSCRASRARSTSSRAWCDQQSSRARRSATRARPSTPLVRQAATSPSPSTESGDTRTATGAIVLTGVLSALYYAVAVGHARPARCSTRRRGDPHGLFDLADQYNQRYPTAATATSTTPTPTISCNDSPVGPTDAVIRSTAAAWATKYPMFGAVGGAVAVRLPAVAADPDACRRSRPPRPRPRGSW